MIRKLIFLASWLALTAGDGDGAEQTDAPAAFAQLKGLVGEWEGKTEAGRVDKVSYRLVANNTVLVETWTLGSQREALTLYHMDGGDLIATHYCPLGNQPRLRLTEARPPSSFIFEFVSATNLAKAESAHQHRFEIELLQPTSFARSETYLENGTAKTERVVYARSGR
jgi:hypothetical protein